MPARGRQWPYSLREWIKTTSSAKSDECMPWPFKLDMRGYPYAKHKNRAYRPTRLMCRIANGTAAPDHTHAAHTCGNRACMNPSHLIWATPKENEQHKREHGRIQHKITDVDVLEIIAARNSGQTTVELARQYGVSHSLISRITRGQRREYVAVGA